MHAPTRREAQRLQEAAVGFVDLLAEVGPDDGAFAVVRVGVGDSRVGDGHLQRVSQEIALPDGQVHVVADRPGAWFADYAARGAVGAPTAFELELVLAFVPLPVRHPA